MNPKEKKIWTLVPPASYDGSFWKLLAAPYCRGVVETESRQDRTFDPGGSQGHLRACPVLGSWGRWFVVRLCMLEQLVTSCSIFPEEIRWLHEARPALCCARKTNRRRGQLEATRTGGTNRGHAVMANRGDWKLGPNGCRRASWSKECLVAA